MCLSLEPCSCCAKRVSPLSNPFRASVPNICVQSIQMKRRDSTISFHASLRGKGLVSALLSVSLCPVIEPLSHLYALSHPIQCPRNSTSRLFGMRSPKFSGSMEFPAYRDCRGNRTDGIVFKHAQRAVGTGPLERTVVARHGHRDEAHHDGAGFRC